MSLTNLAHHPDRSGSAALEASEDAALVASVCAGSAEDFSELVRRYQRMVFGIVSGLLFEQAATEDLVQKVFVNAYRNLDTFDQNRPFGPWIRTIARNAVREHLRRSERYRRRLADYGELLQAQQETDTWPDDRMARMQQLLEDCLAELPKRASKAVQLHYLNGLDTAAVAAELGTSGGGVRNLLCRTRVTLRMCIDRKRHAT